MELALLVCSSAPPLAYGFFDQGRLGLQLCPECMPALLGFLEQGCRCPRNAILRRIELWLINGLFCLGWWTVMLLAQFSRLSLQVGCVWRLRVVSELLS